MGLHQRRVRLGVRGNVYFAYEDQIDHRVLPGEILEVVCGCSSNDDENTELTVYENNVGGLSIHHGDVYAIYVGRNPTGRGLGELIERSVPTFKPEDTASILSRKLSLAQITDVLAWIERNDPNLNPRECSVTCTDFEGTLAEFHSA